MLVNVLNINVTLLVVFNYILINLMFNINFILLISKLIIIIMDLLFHIYHNKVIQYASN